MNLRLILRSFESDSPFSFYFFFLFFMRIKKRGEKGGRRILYFFSFFFSKRKEEARMFLAPSRKTVQFLSLSLPLPFFLSLLPFSPNNHFSFFSFPAKRTTTTTQFVLPSSPFALSAVDRLFCNVLPPLCLFSLPSPFLPSFFPPFFLLFHRLHVSLPVSWKEGG